MFDYKEYVNLTPKQKFKYLSNILDRDKVFNDILVRIFNNKYHYGVRFSKRENLNLLKLAKYETTCDFDKILNLLDNLSSIRQGERKGYILKVIYNKGINQNELFLLLSILNKNIQIGRKQARKLSRDVEYYPFQLAEKYTRNIFNKYQNVYVQYKLDGLRFIYIPKKNKFITRNQSITDSKTSPNLEYIENDFEVLRKRFKNLDDFVFDGEIYCIDWNITSTVVKSEKNKIIDMNIIKNLKFNIFDIIPYDDYINYNPDNDIVSNIKFSRRIKALNKIKNIIENILKLNHISVLTTFNIHDISNLNKLFNESIGKLNFEGLMIKLPDEPYYDKRTIAWMKLKSEKEIDCKIIDIIEGDGKYMNKLGALLCEYNGKIFKVGSGFTDEDREYLWNNKDKVINQVVEINYQELTKDGIPRFPIFKRIRWDKN